MTIRYVFCITVGRSGSDYLTELFAHAQNAVSIHEGLPIMNGEPMRAFNEGKPEAMEALMPRKVAQIQKKRGDPSKVYCETNHSFIKGWGYLLPDRYIPQEEIGVVILRRNPEKVIHSLLRVRSVPGVSEWSRTWYLTPHARENFSAPRRDAGLYELCQWQIDEVNLRAQAYQAQFPRITYVECDLEQLNDSAFVREMFAIFGLIPAPALDSVIGKPLNPKNEWPRLPIEELLRPSPYPSADDLPEKERDALIREMVTVLREEKAQEIAARKPTRLSDSFIFAAREIVARAEEQLEVEFQRKIRYTETEIILIFEFLHAVVPGDIAFFHVTRHTRPHLFFTFDYNVILRLSAIAKKLGIAAAGKLLLLMLPGLRSRDFSHPPHNTAAHQYTQSTGENWSKK